MKNFIKDYPEFARMFTEGSKRQPKDPMKAPWHWLLLGIFGLLCLGGSWQFAFILAGLIALSALINGPAMILWGIVYGVLVGWFPPLALILSALFFFLNLGNLVKGWRVNAVSGWFFLYPLILQILKHFQLLSAYWQVLALTLAGLLALHFLLRWLYQFHPFSHQVAWSIASAPYNLVLFLIPKKWLKREKSPATAQDRVFRTAKRPRKDVTPR